MRCSMDRMASELIGTSTRPEVWSDLVFSGSQYNRRKRRWWFTQEGGLDGPREPPDAGMADGVTGVMRSLRFGWEGR